MPYSGHAHFVEPMLLVRTESLPNDSTRWLYELKFDGYRAIAFKSGRTVHLRSRNDNDFAARYPAVVAGLKGLPPETIVDGEIVALDEQGRPSFNLLQNYRPGAPLAYYVFDVMMCEGRDWMREPLEARKQLLLECVSPAFGSNVSYVNLPDVSLEDMIQVVRAQGLEGVVAKRRDSRYEPGLRSGAWQKMRLNQGQEFVIGGYTPSSKNFDALVFGYYRGSDLIYAARTRNGFTPTSREQLYRRFRGFEISECPFVNLPEAHAGRWGQGLTAEKMQECHWLRPELVGSFEFVEWTPDSHLRHSRFIRLRDDKNPSDVRRES